MVGMLQHAVLLLAAAGDDGAAPATLPPGLLPAPPYSASSNGGFFDKERHTAPAAGRKPHLVFMLLDDWGWGNAGWINPAVEHVTPVMNDLVRNGINMSHHYVFK